jgi:hypothetical protein
MSLLVATSFVAVSLGQQTLILPDFTFNLTNFANQLWVWNMTVGFYDMWPMQMVIDTSTSVRSCLLDNTLDLLLSW